MGKLPCAFAQTSSTSEVATSDLTVNRGAKAIRVIASGKSSEMPVGRAERKRGRRRASRRAPLPGPRKGDARGQSSQR